MKYDNLKQIKITQAHSMLTQTALILGLALLTQLGMLVELVLRIFNILIHIAYLMQQTKQRHIHLL